MTRTASVIPLVTVAGPKQDRSEKTLYRLLDAAEALIAERGLEGLSIPEIVRRAGYSVGGFYARFADKNQLLRALEERFFLQVSARVDALVDARRWRDASPAALVEAAVAELVSVTLERAPMIRVFLYRSVQDPDIREDGLRFQRRVAELIGPLLLARAGTVRHPQPELAVDLAVQLAFGIMQQHVLLDGLQAGGRRLTEKELRREITTFVLSYVGIAPSAGPKRRRARGR
jgi:AcrR family transcriptional regulator